jgi:hypothetical protein
MEEKVSASTLFLQPGGPLINILCSPAAAIGIAKLITATGMYHFCHVLYHQLPWNLPLDDVNAFTNRKTLEILN